MSDWIKPPLAAWQMRVWLGLFYSTDFSSHYQAATRLVKPNSISVARMEKFTQACVISKLKGDHLK